MRKLLLGFGLAFALVGSAMAAVWTLNLPFVGPGTTPLSSGVTIPDYPWLLGYETTPDGYSASAGGYATGSRSDGIPVCRPCRHGDNQCRNRFFRRSDQEYPTGADHLGKPDHCSGSYLYLDFDRLGHYGDFSGPSHGLPGHQHCRPAGNYQYRASIRFRGHQGEECRHQRFQRDHLGCGGKQFADLGELTRNSTLSIIKCVPLGLLLAKGLGLTLPVFLLTLCHRSLMDHISSFRKNSKSFSNVFAIRFSTAAEVERKSWGIARALLLEGYKTSLRILCVREFQASIADSVHKLLSDQIAASWFRGLL